MAVGSLDNWVFPFGALPDDQGKGETQCWYPDCLIKTKSSTVELVEEETEDMIVRGSSMVRIYEIYFTS